MKKNKIWILVLVVIIVLIYSIIHSRMIDKEMNDSETVVATIRSFHYSRTTWNVQVDYYYKNKLIHGEFSTYNIDSLSRNQRVLLKVSKRYPDKYVEYVGIDTVR